jgi:phospholipid/cholesterol/gamma-HCH transport system substrate-binding protein
VKAPRIVALALVATLAAAACTPNPAGGSPQVVEAVVARSNNLFVGSDVRVLGMRVGLVTDLESAGANVLVRMEIQRDIALPDGVRANVKPVSLLGERYVQLDPPYTDGATHPADAVIPLERTSVPAETDEVLESFERFLEGLNPDTLTELVDVVATTIEGQGEGLNQLIDRGGDTIRILADSSDDLMAVVRALGQLNSALATRQQKIGQVIEDWSTVVGTLAEESDEVVAGVGNLRRLVRELRPLLDEHSERLVGDLDVLTTTLSTAERNRDRVSQMVRGSRMLFEGAGRAFDYENARLRLLNHGEDLNAAIQDRLTQRLVGVCFRLGLPVCADELFWSERLPDDYCIEGLTVCTSGQPRIADALTDALGELPAEALEQLREAITAPEDGAPAQPREGVDRLPLPDPRLNSASAASRPSLLDRFASWIGGRR